MQSGGSQAVSVSIEDYIKAIYSLQAKGETVTTQALAVRLGVSPAAVSKMLKRLTELRLIDYAPYSSIGLTNAGEKLALEIIRHHRLLERYLVEALGYSWDEVHQEAERLEHHISEEFETRIDALLGYPTTCPHGDPIPTRDGVMPNIVSKPITSLESPIHTTIRRVLDEDAALLRHLKQLGLIPGTAIEFIEREPYGGAYVLRVGDKIVRLAPIAAQSIFVSEENP